MLKEQNVKFSSETFEKNVPAWEIWDKYKDTAIVWICTSRDKDTKIATYCYLIECRGHKRLSTKNIYGISQNQVMIQGMIDAIYNPKIIREVKKITP